MRFRSSVWLGAIVLLSLLAGCAAKTVNHVLADPHRYVNKEIKLQGRIVESASIAGTGFYRLEDPTGRLWVFSARGVPRRGAHVEVKGRIYDAFDLSSLPLPALPEPLRERIESGLLMVESSHRARY